MERATAMSFWIPCISVIVVFWLGFGLTYFVLRGRVNRLESRMRRMERAISPRQTEDLPRTTPPQPVRPRPVSPSRYITVERQPRY